jgi:hypothetical protein
MVKALTNKEKRLREKKTKNWAKKDTKKRLTMAVQTDRAGPRVRGHARVNSGREGCFLWPRDNAVACKTNHTNPHPGAKRRKKSNNIKYN